MSLDPGQFAVRWTKSPSIYALNEVAAADNMVFASSRTTIGGTSFWGLNASTGHQLWAKVLGDVRSVNSPAYANGKVVIQTGWGNSALPPALFRIHRAIDGKFESRTNVFGQDKSFPAPTPYADAFYLDGGGDRMIGRFDGKRRSDRICAWMCK